MKALKNTRGLTLVELVVATLIFSIMSLTLLSIYFFVLNMNSKYQILDEQAYIINLIKIDIESNVTYSKYVSLQDNLEDSSYMNEDGLFDFDTTAEYTQGIYEAHEVSVEFSGSDSLLTLDINVVFDDISTNEQYSIRLLNSTLDIDETSSDHLIFKAP